MSAGKTTEDQKESRTMSSRRTMQTYTSLNINSFFTLLHITEALVTFPGNNSKLVKIKFPHLAAKIRINIKLKYRSPTPKLIVQFLRVYSFSQILKGPLG